MFISKQQEIINKAIILLALLALILSFTAKFEIYFTRIFGELWNLGHILAFYVWTYLCVSYSKKLQSYSFINQIFIVSSGALLFGGAIEYIQFHIGRAAELADVGRDLLGALLALSIHSSKRTTLGATKLLCMKAVLLLCVILLHRNLLVIPINEYYTYKQFPVLLEPSTPFEKTRVTNSALYTLVKNGDQGKSYFDIKFTTTKYSGIAIDFFPVDWSAYNYIMIDVYNPEQAPYNITCRIHDGLHEDGNEEYSDRFNQSFKLFPGGNKIKINIDKIKNAPATRKMNLAEIASIGLFTTQLEEPKKMHLIKIELGKL